MKKLLALLLATVMLFSIAGCEKDDGESQAGFQHDFDQFVVGYGKADVTPYSPVHLGSYNDAMQRVSTGVLDKFWATTVAFTDTEGNTLLVIVTDLSWGHMNQLTPLRLEVEARFGIPGQNVMLGGTHNHNGPEWMNEGYMQPENQAYFEFWNAGVLSSIEMALNDRKPASMEIGTAETEGVGFVRRYIREDGNIAGTGNASSYPVSSSPIVRHESEGDEEVQMVKIKREGCKDILIAQWQNHACHYGNTTLASTDWVGPMRDKVISELGVDVLYIQGAAGNMATTSMIKEEYPVDLTREQVGEKVADVVIEAYKDPAAFTPINGGKVGVKQTEYTDETGVSWTGELNSVCMGDLSLVTMPVEMFAESGVDIKERTPFAMTLIMCYANGRTSYVGTREAFQHNGYGGLNGYGVYPYGLGTEDTADNMVKIYIDGLKELKGAN